MRPEGRNGAKNPVLTLKFKTMYKIIAKSRYGIEEIDEAETLSEANYLVNEYRMSFGPEFTIVIRRG